MGVSPPDPCSHPLKVCSLILSIGRTNGRSDKCYILCIGRTNGRSDKWHILCIGRTKDTFYVQVGQMSVWQTSVGQTSVGQKLRHHVFTFNNQYVKIIINFNYFYVHWKFAGISFNWQQSILFMQSAPLLTCNELLINLNFGDSGN